MPNQCCRQSVRPDGHAGMPRRRNRRRRASWPAAACGSRSRSRSAHASAYHCGTRRTSAPRSRCGSAWHIAINVTPRPSSAARHIASGSSRHDRLLERHRHFRRPRHCASARSRIRPVRDERMTMPSNAASPDGSAGGVRSLEIGRRRDRDEVQRARARAKPCLAPSSMPPPIAASNPSAIRSTCRLSKCQSGRMPG